MIKNQKISFYNEFIEHFEIKTIVQVGDLDFHSFHEFLFLLNEKSVNITLLNPMHSYDYRKTLIEYKEILKIEKNKSYKRYKYSNVIIYDLPLNLTFLKKELIKLVKSDILEKKLVLINCNNIINFDNGDEFDNNLINYVREVFQFYLPANLSEIFDAKYYKKNKHILIYNIAYEDKVKVFTPKIDTNIKTENIIIEEQKRQIAFLIDSYSTIYENYDNLLIARNKNLNKYNKIKKEISNILYNTQKNKIKKKLFYLNRYINNVDSNIKKVPDIKLKHIKKMKFYIGTLLRNNPKNIVKYFLDKKYLVKSRHFNIEYYNYINDDIYNLGISPYFHYYFYAEKEDRKFSRTFSRKAYIKTNPDVSNEYVNSFIHYEKYGKYEGRTFFKYGLENQEKYELTLNKPIDKKNRNIAIFASYDNDGNIYPYVVHYIKKLKEIVDDIIFVSDCFYDTEEIMKISDYLTHCIIGRHGLYDFGSYKLGAEYIYNNYEQSEIKDVILANDSCFAPINSFKDMYNKMESTEYVWGNTINSYGYRLVNGEYIKSSNLHHIQSYFVCFPSKIYFTDMMKNFFASIEKKINKHDIIIQYEIGMSKLLISNGIEIRDIVGIAGLDNPISQMYRELIEEYKSPFLKISNARVKNIDFIENYPKNYISDYLESKNLYSNSKRNLTILNIVNEDNMYKIVVLHEYAKNLYIEDSQGNIYFPSQKESALDYTKYLFNSNIRKKYDIFNINKEFIDNNYFNLKFSFISDYEQELCFLDNNKRNYNFFDSNNSDIKYYIDKNELILCNKKVYLKHIYDSNKYTLIDKLIAFYISNIAKPKNVVYAEKKDLAMDNSYQLFSYAKSIGLKKHYFIYGNNKRKGFVKINTLKHFFKVVNAKSIVTSWSIYDVILNNKYIKNIHIPLLTFNHYLVPHGITAGDKHSFAISKYMFGNSKKIYVSSEYEKKYLENVCGYIDVETLGYPRMDKWTNITELDENEIILFFTWRYEFLNMKEEFFCTTYFNDIVNMVNYINEVKSEIKIKYFIHNSINSYINKNIRKKLLEISPNIEFIRNESDKFNEEFAKSKYMITDYSSVGYDFAYKDGAVTLFYVNDLFIEKHYQLTDKFDDICTGYAIRDIKELDLILDKKYDMKYINNKKTKFFNYIDNLNSKRVLENIVN